MNKKILFIYPKFDRFLDSYPELCENKEYANIGKYKMPPALGIPTLVACTPKDWEYEIIDQNIQDIPYEGDHDLIAVSFFTPQASYAYELGDHFRSIGKKVVMGGMHPSALPHQTKLHCDSVCIGEGDLIWAKILDDYDKNELKEMYYPEPVLPEMWPITDKNLFRPHFKSYDWKAALVQVTRGCQFNCSTCNQTIISGKNLRFRNIDDVEREIKKYLVGYEFYLIDDTIMQTLNNCNIYMKQLCERIAKYNVNMFISASPSMNTDPEFLATIRNAGCRSLYTVFAFDFISQFAFRPERKRIFNMAVDVVKRVHDAGIEVFGSFSLGFDFHDLSVFDKILEFISKANIRLAEFFIATPFPKTQFSNKLQEMGRIITTDWKKYNCANVVFVPKNMSENQLLDGYLHCWKEFFKMNKKEQMYSSFSTFNLEKWGLDAEKVK